MDTGSIFVFSEDSYPIRAEVDRDILSLLEDFFGMGIVDLDEDLSELSQHKRLQAITEVHIHTDLSVDMAFSLLHQSEGFRSSHQYPFITSLHIGSGLGYLDFFTIKIA